MSVFRYYLTYPKSDMLYSSEIEITDYVIEGGSSNISQNLTNNEYDVGTIRFNKLSLKLVNSDGFFGEASSQLSVFEYKRDGSILRVEWDINPHGNSCGTAPCGYTFLSDPITIYKGLLEDNSSDFDETTQVQTFTFLGMESIIGKVQTNFSELSVSDSAETTIYNLLNQTKITSILTLDVSNINVDFDFTPDDISDLEDTTVLAAIERLLFLSNSVMYIKDDVIYVKSQDSGGISKATLYGKTAQDGIENIVALDGFTTGINRTFNFWKWADTSVKQSFADSISRNGFRQKEVDDSLVTNSTIQTNILNTLLNEYGFPKREIEVTVPMYTPLVKNIFLLDRINLDIPQEYSISEGDDLVSRYGFARYGTGRYAEVTGAFTINVNDNWKVMNRNISLKNRLITFRLREE